MIFVGIDDTDTLDSKGTNQLARAIAAALHPTWPCELILRHQLLDDPRVPYTSKNGSASLTLIPADGTSLDSVINICKSVMREWFVKGSDPGLCVTQRVPESVAQFGQRCKTTLMTQEEARHLASEEGIYLEGLGGTEQGVIGALAAVGLAVGGNDGRVVQLGQFPDDLTGVLPVECVRSRGVSLHDLARQRDITEGFVDLGKKLRPNRSAGCSVLFVENCGHDSGQALFKALKLP